MTEPPLRSARPSKGVQILAFLSICIAGAIGGIVGYAYQNIQCDENCGLSKWLFALGSAVATSVGVSIMVILILRATEEWKKKPKKP